MKAPATKRIALHIEELVLHGFAPGARHEIAATLERELGALVAARGLPSVLARPGEHPYIDAGQFHLSSSAPPQAVGADIAATLYGGLTR